VTYIATEASTAFAMHASKMLVYSRYITLHQRDWIIAALLAVAMVLGSWIGKRSVERLSAERFRLASPCSSRRSACRCSSWVDP
jgi:uncharacterized membrane protein YfcA